MKFERERNEVLSALLKEGGWMSGEKLAFIRNYMKCEMRFVDLKVPGQRKIAKKGFSFARERSPQELLETWSWIYSNTDVFEVRSQAILFYEKHEADIAMLKAVWPRLKGWATELNNWAHSDGLSSLYAQTLEHDDALVYPTLVEWNRARNPWLRRQSIVSLLYYAAAREKILPAAKMFPLVEALVDDPEFYVQRGVGWTLRELGNVYRKDTDRFLDKHITRLSSIAFSAATEKVTAARKATLKRARKAAREA